MTAYVALLRGIGPSNPNMHSSKLKAAFEALGFKNVRTVIASGNVVFENASKSADALEAAIEDGLEKLLGFRRTAIVRSRDELSKLAARDPFKGVKDEKPNYLLVTFFKDHRKEACAAIDLRTTDGPEAMRLLEKSFGKEITSRTWKTVGRILKAMG